MIFMDYKYTCRVASKSCTPFPMSLWLLGSFRVKSTYPHQNVSCGMGTRAGLRFIEEYGYII